MNIYITIPNEEFLKTRKGSMSGLINKLLDDYRNAQGKDLHKINQTPILKTIEPEQTPPEIIKTKEDAVLKVKEVFKGAQPMKFCKNGHPIPEGSTKCLGKGCKYA